MCVSLFIFADEMVGAGFPSPLSSGATQTSTEMSNGRLRLAQPEVVVQRHDDADRGGNDGIHDAIVDTSPDVVPLKGEDLVFGDLHPSRLAVSDKHFNVRFKTSQLLQDFSLKVVIDDVYHDRPRAETAVQ